MKYNLCIRIGTEYHPVNYETAQVCYDEDRPTVFSGDSRDEVITEMIEAGHAPNDYKFIEVLDQTLTPKEFETRLTLVGDT